MHYVADKNNSVISVVGVDIATLWALRLEDATPPAILYTSRWRVKHRICVLSAYNGVFSTKHIPLVIMIYQDCVCACEL